MNVDDRKLFVWTWDQQLVMYHDIVAKCYKNIEVIQTSIWSKIFKSLAKRKLDSEYACMDWANSCIEARVKELEEVYGEKVIRFNTISGDWL